MAPKSSRHRPQPDGDSPGRPGGAGQRLQKVLAAAGIASRRECETLIVEGRVEVDGEIVTELGTRVDPTRQEIRVDGDLLARPRHVYYLVNKPVGVVSTNRDPEGRARVVDLVPSETRLFTIGRLDRSSEGMIILTNDGELTNQLTHPRYGIPKTYRAKVVGALSAETIEQLGQGIHLAEGLARVASLHVRARDARGSELEIVLTEGRNREIRRILAKVGHKVQQLRRIAIGPIRLGKLAPGEYRLLSFDEVRQLRRAVQRVDTLDASHCSPRPKKSPTRSRGKFVRDSQAGSRSGNIPAKPRKGAGTKARRPGGQAASGEQRPGGERKTKPPVGMPRKGSARPGTVLDYDDAASHEPATPRPRKKSPGKGTGGAGKKSARPPRRPGRKGKRP